MVPIHLIKEIEEKDFSQLTDEEVIIWQYWNVYKEANLWYSMMVNAPLSDNGHARALSYARKGKSSALKALALQGSLMLLWANDAKKLKEANFNTDKKIVSIALQAQTETIAFVSQTPQSNVEQLAEFMSKVKQKSLELAKADCVGSVFSEDKISRVKDTLASRGLVINEEAGEKTKIHMRLKILDNLFYSGKITEKVYNKKCKELADKKAKVA
jgi:hypothetical protein